MSFKSKSVTLQTKMFTDYKKPSLLDKKIVFSQDVHFWQTANMNRICQENGLPFYGSSMCYIALYGTDVYIMKNPSLNPYSKTFEKELEKENSKARNYLQYNCNQACLPFILILYQTKIPPEIQLEILLEIFEAKRTQEIFILYSIQYYNNKIDKILGQRYLNDFRNYLHHKLNQKYILCIEYKNI